MITYNDPKTSKERAEVLPPTIKEVVSIVELMNSLPYKNHELLQRFVYHYENMEHYVACTGGLWATDVPDKVTDPENVLFQIEF